METTISTARATLITSPAGITIIDFPVLNIVVDKNENIYVAGRFWQNSGAGNVFIGLDNSMTEKTELPLWNQPGNGAFFGIALDSNGVPYLGFLDPASTNFAISRRPNFKVN